MIFSALGGALGGAAFGFLMGRLLSFDAGDEVSRKRRNTLLVWSLGGAGLGALIAAATPPCHEG